MHACLQPNWRFFLPSLYLHMAPSIVFLSAHCWLAAVHMRTLILDTQTMTLDRGSHFISSSLSPVTACGTVCHSYRKPSRVLMTWVTTYSLLCPLLELYNQTERFFLPQFLLYLHIWWQSIVLLTQNSAHCWLSAVHTRWPTQTGHTGHLVEVHTSLVLPYLLAVTACGTVCHSCAGNPPEFP